MENPNSYVSHFFYFFCLFHKEMYITKMHKYSLSYIQERVKYAYIKHSYAIFRLSCFKSLILCVNTIRHTHEWLAVETWLTGVYTSHLFRHVLVFTKNKQKEKWKTISSGQLLKYSSIWGVIWLFVILFVCLTLLNIFWP